LPVNAPVNPVELTDVNPVNVVTVAPNETAVAPIVTALLDNAPFGIALKFVPVNVGVSVQIGAPAVSCRTPVPCARYAVAPAPD